MTDEQIIQHSETNPAVAGSTLPDRMDNAIGEASSGIGHMVSELVRRSLRGSVADIDGILKGFAEEQVDVAVERQMPALTESAQTIAESTSKRITDEAIGTTVEKLSTDIRSAEERAVNKSEEIGKRLEEDINSSRQQFDETAKDLNALRQGAKETWKQLLEQFDAVNRENTAMKSRIQELESSLREVRSQASAQASELATQHQSFADRLAELERPRGMKALWNRFKRKPKADA